MGEVNERLHDSGFYKVIAPIITSVFAVYLTIGMTLGILPGYIHNKLGYSSLFVGIAIGLQGFGLAFSSIGFACISSFIALLFVQENWGNASVAFMVFGGSYILVRIFFSSYPDKYGGYKVALFSLIIEIIGLLFIRLSISKTMAIVGCGLTGAGFSLIFPSLGVLAIKKVTPQMRGTALGAYAAFFDLSLGIAAPVAGLIATWFNYQSVYLFGAISCLLAMFILVLRKD